MFENGDFSEIDMNDEQIKKTMESEDMLKSGSSGKVLVDLNGKEEEENILFVEMIKVLILFRNLKKTF